MDEFEKKYHKYKSKYLALRRGQRGGQNNTLNVINVPTTDIPKVRDDGRGDINVKKHLLLYEILNYQGANNQNFQIFNQIYDTNATIRMANEPGLGFKENQSEMMQMYKLVPNITVENGVQFGSGEWLAVEQTITGKVTGQINNDPECKPTGQSFSVRGCSLVRWKNDKIIEETIFWDNDSYKNQTGIKKAICAGYKEQPHYDLNQRISFTTFGRGDESNVSNGSNESNELIRKRMLLFEEFNFNGYNKRNWKLAHDLYHKDAILIFPDGQKLEGINQILEQMTNGMNDDVVVSIPIHFGSGDWTAASMLMTGTLKDDKSKRWVMEHCALIKWQGEKIIEAHAFFDGMDLRKQTGIPIF